MRILICHRPPGAFGYISDGWLNALATAGHEVKRWDGQRQSWEDFAPDLYIGCSGHRQQIPADRSKTVVAIHVNPYCAINVDGINENQAAIRWVLDQKPQVVFGYGHESDNGYWEYWTSKHGIPWVPLPTAGDSVIYYDRNVGRDIDIAYVGGYWPYKAKNIDKYLLPVINCGRLSCMVRGWGHWPGTVHGINDNDVPGLLSRAKIGPCISEPHTTTWGIDLPERLWKVALCGALVIHDPVKGLNRFMESAIVASDPYNYLELCKYFAAEQNQQERLDLVRRQRNEVLTKNTYFQRMAVLFMAIGKVTGSAFVMEAEKLAAYRTAIY